MLYNIEKITITDMERRELLCLSESLSLRILLSLRLSHMHPLPPSVTDIVYDQLIMSHPPFTLSL
jgi:hypothetical protein